jgi:hypothetical protein
VTIVAADRAQLRYFAEGMDCHVVWLIWGLFAARTPIVTGLQA